MREYSLEFYKKVRVWFNENLDADYQPVNQLKDEYNLSNYAHGVECNVALELFIPAGPKLNYGLLGASFMPNESGKLSILTNISDNETEHYENSLNRSMDKYYKGLPTEYYSGIISGIKSVVDENLILPSGTVLINKSAHGLIDSSNMMFYMISRAIILLIKI
jgi:hypothetical protein